MNKYKKGFIASLAFCLSIFALPSLAKNYQSVEMGDQFKLIETQEGMVLMSKNGRYVFKGQIYDVWKKEELTNIEHYQTNNSKIPLQEMSIDFSSLNTYSIGDQQKPNVVIFVDPLCTACHLIIKNSEQLTQQYSFTFVVVPALGQKSNQLAKRFFCSTDRKKGFKALRENTLDKLPQQNNCDTVGYNQTLMLAKLVGINGVPMIIAPDQSIGRGVPDDLATWLKIRS